MFSREQQGIFILQNDFGDDNVERFNKGMEAVQALQQGKIDAVSH